MAKVSDGLKLKIGVGASEDKVAGVSVAASEVSVSEVIV